MRFSETRLLQKCPLFEELTEDEVDALIGVSEIKSFTKGAIVFKERDTSRNIYVILEGSLGVRKHIIDKKDDTMPLSPVIAEHGAGETVGEFSFFDDNPRSAEVFAMTDTRTLVFNPETFNDYTSEFPRASQKIMVNIVKILLHRIRKTDEQLSIALEWGWEAHGFAQ